MKSILANMEYIEQLNIYPRTIELDCIDGAQATQNGNSIDLFSINDYLGLSQSKEIWLAATDAYSRFGFGARATRMAGGTFTILKEFEKQLGEFAGKDDSVTFASGYQANFSVIPAICNLLQLDNNRSFIVPTTIFVDQFAHGSLYDAVRMASVPSKVFPHNKTSGLARSLERCSTPRKLIIIDGLYSVEADLAPLPDILALAEKYNALVYMDDAHGIGSIGKSLGGTADFYNMAQHPNLVVAGTLSKTLGGIGGFVAGPVQFCKLMRVAARSSLLSHTLPPNMICGFLKALEILHRDGLKLRTQLLANIKYTRTKLLSLGLTLLGSEDIPIIPVMVGDEKLSLEIGDELLLNGILAPPFRYPVVPRGSARIRITISSIHERNQLEHLVRAFETVCHKFPSLVSEMSQK